MLITGINIFLVIILIWITYQDIRNRHVHVFLLIALFSAAVIINYFSNNLNYFEALKIVGFVLLNMVGLTIYFSLKSRKLINPIDKFLGLGDVIFLISITPIFTLKRYMAYFITGLLFSLLVHMLFKNFVTDKTVPLAGYLSIYLIVLILVNLVLDYNLFVDEY